MSMNDAMLAAVHRAEAKHFQFISQHVIMTDEVLARTIWVMLP